MLVNGMECSFRGWSVFIRDEVLVNGMGCYKRDAMLVCRMGCFISRMAI